MRKARSRAATWGVGLTLLLVTPLPDGIRVLCGLVGGAILFVLFLEFVWDACRKWDGRTALTGRKQQTAPAPKAPDTARFAARPHATLFQLIVMFEFPGSSAIQQEIILDNPLAVATVARLSIMYDSQRRMSFNVIHIPLNANAENAALHVLGEVAKMREHFTTDYDRQYGDNSRVIGERFAYSDKIFIYHEPLLPEDQRKTIWDQYKAAGYIVEFRGPKYIADLKKRHGAIG